MHPRTGASVLCHAQKGCGGGGKVQGTIIPQPSTGGVTTTQHHTPRDKDRERVTCSAQDTVWFPLCVSLQCCRCYTLAMQKNKNRENEKKKVDKVYSCIIYVGYCSQCRCEEWKNVRNVLTTLTVLKKKYNNNNIFQPQLCSIIKKGTKKRAIGRAHQYIMQCMVSSLYILCNLLSTVHKKMIDVPFLYFTTSCQV